MYKQLVYFDNTDIVVATKIQFINFTTQDKSWDMKTTVHWVAPLDIEFHFVTDSI